MLLSNCGKVLTAMHPGCSGRRMWRHIPKITVLAAIGLLVLTVYFTQWNGSGAPGPGKAPNVVYINQDVGSGGR